jgi:uncharacterized membrane protein SpoIIM required for sporulation
MPYHSPALAIAAIYIFGLWWCYKVITRFRQDLREIFELKEVTRTVVIIFIWIITIPIMLALVLYGYVGCICTL